MAEISELQLGARDFVYLESRGWIFVAMSEMNIGNRLDSYITNVSKSTKFKLSKLSSSSVLNSLPCPGRKRNRKMPVTIMRCIRPWAALLSTKWSWRRIQRESSRDGNSLSVGPKALPCRPAVCTGMMPNAYCISALIKEDVSEYRWTRTIPCRIRNWRNWACTLYESPASHPTVVEIISLASQMTEHTRWQRRLPERLFARQNLRKALSSNYWHSISVIVSE